MKVFGTIYPFVETHETSLKFGRFVANYEFLKHLLIFGSFDEYHLFCLSVSHFNMTKNRLNQETIPHTQKGKIRLFLYNNLIEQIKENDYFVFHLGGWGYFFPGLVYLRNSYSKNKFPITGIIHSLNGIETKYHALKLCTAPLLPYDTIICSSYAGEKVLTTIFNEINHDFSSDTNNFTFTGNTKIIPLGFDNTFNHVPDKEECRKTLDLTSDAIVLLALHRFSPHTKVDILPLLKTFKRLIDSFSDTPLVLCLAGAASDTEMIHVRQAVREWNVQHSVRFFFNFDHALKPTLYGAADIYVSLSDNLQETFGISVIEAMASGLPAIVSDIDGYSELINQGVNGFTVPCVWIDDFNLLELADIMDFNTMQLILAQCMAIDTEKLFEYLHRLIQDFPLRIKIGTCAKEKVQKSFCWSSIIDHYEHLWNMLYERSKGYTKEVPKPNNPFLHNYGKTFKHYPTSVIHPNQLCSLTAFGKDVLNTGIIPLAFSDIASILDNDTIMNILQLLFGQAGTVKTILLHNSNHIGTDRTKFILLWMAKYSLINITAGIEK